MVVTAQVLQAGVDAGLAGTAAQLAPLAGSIVLLLMLIGLGGVAYKHFRGDGIRWPDEQDDEDDAGVSRTGDDTEWKYS